MLVMLFFQVLRICHYKHACKQRGNYFKTSSVSLSMSNLLLFEISWLFFTFIISYERIQRISIFGIHNCCSAWSNAMVTTFIERTLYDVDRWKWVQKWILPVGNAIATIISRFVESLLEYVWNCGLIKRQWSHENWFLEGLQWYVT